MKNYEIWSEGYAITGNRSDAQYHGIFSGETFEEACLAWAKTVSQPELYDVQNNSYWGCRLFDNEFDARKSFG